MRIFRTCARLGIGTVAVYSDADKAAMHVREADRAIHIGPAPAAESYLNQARILAAAKEAGVDAIHPGYGFLSENAGFARAVRKAGLIWVGPAPETIISMGLKDEAKRIAEEAGVPVLPGYRGKAQDAETLGKEAKAIGYPLLIKAIAGGGGRGIRLVSKASGMKDALESAVREAKAAFGDERVMLEKLVERPRHIEVQVFGDCHGNVVHMYERDCSLQRRRQKVIEEAPAPNMPDTVRKAMTEAAVKLAKAVNYQGAGTVEFIVDGSRELALDSFWFLEMNTRLQVEHPVTEMVTGLDLVEWQLRVAAGGKLPCKQKDISLNGHAIEARICAEDPGRDFRPGAGRIDLLDHSYADCLADTDWIEEHPEQPAARVDFGFEAGDTIPPDYDSMLGKLIIHDEAREAARRILRECLEDFSLGGVQANIGFLARCLDLEEFLSGTHHVNLIAQKGAGLAESPDARRQIALQAAAAAICDRGPDVWDNRDGWRANLPPVREVRLRLGEEILSVTPGDESELPVQVHKMPGRVFLVNVLGDMFDIHVPSYASDAESLLGGDVVKAPMPGKVIDVRVKAGEAVAKGDTLAVMEAMKMEHSLAAPRDGIVAKVNVKTGAQIAEGVVLVELAEE